MQNSVKLSLGILREALTGDKVDVGAPTEEELAESFLLLKKHDLAHLGTEVLRAHGVSLPEKLKKSFEAESTLAVYRYTRLWQAFDKISAVFEEAGIDYLPLKGAYLREAYPRPEMRTSCDVDVLVKETTLFEATSLLIDKLGFKKDGETFHDVSLTLGEGIHLELHYNVTENDERIDPILTSVWENATAVDATHRFRMTSAFFAFHVIAHMYSHFSRGGCGIRTLMDLWVLRHRTDFDEEGARALCEKARLLPFYETAVQLSETWFSGSEHTDLSTLMQDFILKGGVYGTRENRVVAGAGQKKSMIRFIFSRIFLPKKYLVLSYPVLKEKPFLLPICYVRRWIRILFRGRGKAAFGELSHAATLPKEAKETAEVLFHRLEID